jgi:hypothetical protein
MSGVKKFHLLAEEVTISDTRLRASSTSWVTGLCAMFSVTVVSVTPSLRGSNPLVYCKSNTIATGSEYYRVDVSQVKTIKINPVTRLLGVGMDCTAVRRLGFSVSYRHVEMRGVYGSAYHKISDLAVSAPSWWKGRS